MRSHPTVLLVCALAINPRLGCAQRPDPQPPWRSRLMPWETHAGQRRPWRTDARLADFVEQGYPDDILVLFGSPDSLEGRKPETLSVTVTAYDSASGLFLGIIREKPHGAMDVARATTWSSASSRPAYAGGCRTQS